MLERRISGTGSGLWLGTPTATMSVRSEPFRRGAAPTPAEFVKWPTPRAGNPGSRPNGKGGKVLAEEVEIAAGLRQRGERMWPTPTTLRGISKEAAEKEWERKGSADLRMAVHLWPTPTAHNAKETTAPSENDRNTPTLAAQVGGQLNPTWVEWLMGWPLGWTDLKPLATAKSPSAPQQPGGC